MGDGGDGVVVCAGVVIEAREVVLSEAECFAQAALDEVSGYGRSAAAADGEAEPGVREVVGDGEDGDRAARLAGFGGVDGLELPCVGEAVAAAEGE